jgi:hypothetical protein
MRTLFLLFLFALFFFPTHTNAHDLAPDGPIRAVIHIDPLDKPIAEEASTIHIDIVDHEKKFTYENCICTLTISKNHEEIFSTQLNNDMGHMPVVSYIFPEKNEYELKISGLPKIENAFQPFTLTYKVQVESEKSQEDMVEIVLGSVIILLVGIILVLYLSRKK